LGTTPAVKGTEDDLRGLSALARKNSRLLSEECSLAGAWKKIAQKNRNKAVPNIQGVALLRFSRIWAIEWRDRIKGLLSFVVVLE
jgi:hypothetical protein